MVAAIQTPVRDVKTEASQREALPSPTELQQAETDLAHSKHIMEVARNLMFFASELMDRAGKHDASKMEEPEASAFAVVNEQLAATTYGSPEYNEAKARLGSALAHHYANNRHHPEHWQNGVRDMTLIDVVEMFCDWQASSKRHNDGNLHKSIAINSHRFNMGSQLTEIFENTARIFDE
jgi:hypothetical protein